MNCRQYLISTFVSNYMENFQTTKIIPYQTAALFGFCYFEMETPKFPSRFFWRTYLRECLVGPYDQTNPNFPHHFSLSLFKYTQTKL